MEHALLHINALILHIGSWKTGTTSIQSFLARNAGRLKKEGILYPQTTRNYSLRTDNAHHRLSAMLSAADGRMTRDIADVLRKIDNELKASCCDKLLLSSETFMEVNRPETLARYLSADEVSIVVNLRNQADFVNAMYYTEVCHLKVIDLPKDYLAAYDPRKLDYLTELDRWATVWPGAKIKVSLFDKGSPARAFPVKHFLDSIGLNWELNENENTREHVTQSAQATMVLRKLAEIGYSDEEFYEIFQLFQNHPTLFASLRCCLSPDIMSRIEATYAEQNQKLAEKYLPDDATGFAPLDLPSTEEWAAIMSSPEEIFPAFLHFVVLKAANRIC